MSTVYAPRCSPSSAALLHPQHAWHIPNQTQPCWCRADISALLLLQLYIPPTDKEQLLLELQKPSRLVKALQALFDDRCLSYVKKDVMMGVLKDLVKSNKAISKAQNKAVPDAEGRSFNLLQMIIRYGIWCGATQLCILTDLKQDISNSRLYNCQRLSCTWSIHQVLSHAVAAALQGVKLCS